MGFNITKHAIIRYIQRKELHEVITENTYEMWRKNHLEEDEKYRKDLMNEFENAIFLTFKPFDKIKNSEYRYNVNSMFVYILDRDTLNIVTCYPLDYGLDEEGNRDMLFVLLKHKEKVDEELKIADEKYIHDKETIMFNISKYSEEISELEKEIQLKKIIKKELEAQLNTVEATYSNIKSKKDCIIDKIVRPKFAL